MSELKVDKITPRLGTTLTLGDTGDTINFGSGVLPNFENLTVTGDLTVDTNSLKVDSTNNFVGIGTASPSVALDVVGAITATGNITGTLATASQPNITSVGTLTSATISGDLTVDTSTLYVDSTNNYVKIGSGANRTGFLSQSDGNLQIKNGIIFESGDAAIDNEIFTYRSNDLLFGTSGSEKMRITSDGRVGIGNTATDIPGTSHDTVVIGDGTNNTGIILTPGNTSNATFGFYDGVGSYPSARMLWSTSDQLVFYTKNSGGTGESPRMYIDTSGRVGIDEGDNSTYDLGKKLVVGALGNNDGITLKSSNTTNTNYIAFGDADTGTASYSGFFGYNHTDNSLRLGTNSSERMRIDSSGNVGIGNTLYALSSSQLQILFGGIGSLLSGTGVGGTTEIRSNSYYNSANQHIYQVSDEASRYKQTNGTHNFDVAPTGTAGGVVTWTNAMSIDNSGNVIATSGSLNLVGTNTQIFAASNGDDIQFKFAGTTRASINNGGRVAAGDGSNAAPGIRFYDDPNTGFVRPGSDNIATITGGAERMRINSSGNVGIGTSSPSVKLDVNGTIRTAVGSATAPALAVGDADTGIYDGGTNILAFTTGGTHRMNINGSGHLVPATTNTYDLGSSSLVWRNIYTSDFHMSNEGLDKGNDIDGTKGSWTFQEGENDLFLINNKNGKKYKFNLTEVA